VAAWLGGGRTLAELERRLNAVQPLSEYECELLSRASVKVAGNERFSRLAKVLLTPGPFAGLLPEAKGDELEGRAAKENSTARLIWRIKAAIAAA